MVGEQWQFSYMDMSFDLGKNKLASYKEIAIILILFMYYGAMIVLFATISLSRTITERG